MEAPSTLSPYPYFEHGSADSLDIDRVYVMPALPPFQECQRLCKNEGLINKNIITIENGAVRDCFKGLPDEINNGILATYALHQQNHPCLVTGQVKRIITLKLLRGIRVILTRITRTSVRASVKSALSSSSFAQRLSCLAAVDFVSLAAELNADDWKSLAFQIAQCYLLCTGVEIFTKSDVITHFPALTPLIRRAPDSSASLVELNALRTRLLVPLIGALQFVYNGDRFCVFGAADAFPDSMSALKEEMRHGVVMDVKRERLVAYPCLPDALTSYILPTLPHTSIVVTFRNHNNKVEALDYFTLKPVELPSDLPSPLNHSLCYAQVRLISTDALTLTRRHALTQQPQ